MTWSLPTEGIFQVNDQNRPVANLPVVVFCSQPREMTLPKAEYVTFGFYFRSLVFFLFKGSLNITVLKLRGFFSVLAAIIQKHCDKLAMNYSFFRTYATTSPVVESDAVRCMDQTDIHVNALQESLKKVTLLLIKFTSSTL